jgi:hypothetical protein
MMILVPFDVFISHLEIKINAGRARPASRGYQENAEKPAPIAPAP